MVGLFPGVELLWVQGALPSTHLVGTLCLLAPASLCLGLPIIGRDSFSPLTWKLFHPTASELEPEGGVGSLRPVEKARLGVGQVGRGQGG